MFSILVEFAGILDARKAGPHPSPTERHHAPIDDPLSSVALISCVIRQSEAERDFALLLEAEAAVARLVVADPDSAVHNAKRLLILTTVLKAPPAAIAESERTRCRGQAFEVEALLLKNQAETRIEDRALIDFRSCLREIATSAGDHEDVAAQCEKLLEYTLHYASGGFGTTADLESARDTLLTWYRPALLRIDPEHAESRYSFWLGRLRAVGTSRFPGSDVTNRLRS